MKTQRWWLILAVLLLMAASLSCGLFSGGDETPEAAVSSQSAEGNPEAESETPPQDAGESQPSQPSAPPINLGNTYRSEMGGYAFQAIPGYEVEEAFGFASMTAPDADPEEGPTFLLIGGTNDEPVTTEELFNEFMEKPDEEDVVILEQREVIVDGKPGILAELEGKDDNDETIRVQVVVVAVSDMQGFMILATAPMDRWGEIAANFDSVLSSVSFFEPQEVSPDALDDMIEETPEDSADEDTGDSGEYDLSDLEALGDFPSQASDLPPGGFAILLADTEGSLVLVSGEQAQPQPAGDEYVVVLSGLKPENTVTLFLPHNSAADMLMMVPYDANAALHAPGVIIQLGSTLYTGTDGIIMVEAMDGDTISGSMFFVAVDESGAELSVSGFFNELPLTP